ncbi:MAG: hypothetical protein HYV06_06110 [Deltaproteobacteria bacterium]|nr:hypothetical protein [Deltaproteobacteria bacterium]
MADPVTEIGGVKETGRNTTRGGNSKRDKGKGRPHRAEDDSVDISEEARQRASGKKRGNILEYLKNAGD